MDTETAAFLAPVDATVCLYTSSILMPVSIFILSTTVHQVSLDRVREPVTLYILGVKVATSFFGISTSIMAHISAVFWPKKLTSWILMIMGILSSFGAMMSISTIFFKSNWTNHTEAMRHVMFLITEIVMMTSSMILSIKLALKFKSHSEQNYFDFPQSYVTISGVLLAALLLLASVTSFVGFIIGIYVNTQLLRETTVTGGGLYSGFLGILTGIIYVSSVKMCKTRNQRYLHPMIIMLGVLTIVSATTSYLTEELELSATIAYMKKHEQVFNDYVNYKILLLSKSTLVELSSLFMTIFTCPLIVSCYILAFGCQSETFHSTNSNENDLLMHKYQNNKFSSSSTNGVLKQPIHIDSLEISAMTATTSGINGDCDDR